MAQIDSNLVSCFLCCRAAVNAMMAASGGGRIVNVAARPALEPRSGAGMTAYTIAKAGVAALTVALAEEVAKDGILVNAVAPSIMDTAANRKAMPKADFDAWPKVEEVAATILFLASPDNQRHPRRHRAGVREIVALACDRHQFERRAQQPLHRTGGDHGAAFRIGLVVLLDVVEVVLVVHHQTVRLRHRLAPTYRRAN